MLKALFIEAHGRGRVVRMPSAGTLSDRLKFYLRRAGVTRADLFVSDATRKAVTFHDLRATGTTWCAVRGDDSLKILQRAGHADFETTKIYLREAENLAQGFGEIFPAVPGSLLHRTGRDSMADGSATVSDSAIVAMTNQPKTSGSEWADRDSNPGPTD